MKTMLLSAAFAFCAVSVPAQEPAKPGAEHDVLKKYEGNWDLVMKAGGQETKGTATWKMELGGMWLVGNLEGEMFGSKFTGKMLDSYDATKKKYVSIWVDSMGGGSVMTEGTYDQEKNTRTLTGIGPGMDGKETKYKSVSVTDGKKATFTMYVGDAKEPAFVIEYKKKS